MGKKNIDRLFQEKFSDFSDAPTEKVWKSIEASLDMKKKKRKVAPVWWKLAGVAAVLAIGLFLFNPYNTGGDGPETKVTDIENTKEKPLNTRKGVDQFPLSNTPKVVGRPHSGNDGKIEGKTGYPSKNRTNKSNLRPVSGNNSKEILVVNDKVGQTLKTQDSKNTQIATYGRNPKKDIGGSTVIKEEESTTFLNEQIVENDSYTKTPSPAKNSENILDDAESKTNGGIATVEDKDAEGKTGDAKKSIFDEIGEEEEVATAKGSKWSAGPTIAPVYFNAIGNGSPVHSVFVPNSKSGDLNMSYGIAVSYKISPKLSVKTGINKVDYGYNTNDVEFSPSLDGFGNGKIKNITYNDASTINIQVESTTNNNNPLTKRTAYDASAKDPTLSGGMAQQFGYLEVPLELNYALVNNKFGVDLIGGVSSLFLMDNSVSLTSGELTAKMGEANNLNTVNFSANVGFGLHYRINPKIQLDIDPMFKYQLNTFSNTAGEFHPFTISIYSGLNFRF